MFPFCYSSPIITLITAHAIVRLRDTQRKKLNRYTKLELAFQSLYSDFWENRYWWLFFVCLFVCLICFLLCGVVKGSKFWWRHLIFQTNITPACMQAYIPLMAPSAFWKLKDVKCWGEKDEIAWFFFDSINCCYRNKLLFFVF